MDSFNSKAHNRQIEWKDPLPLPTMLPPFLPISEKSLSNTFKLQRSPSIRWNFTQWTPEVLDITEFQYNKKFWTRFWNSLKLNQTSKWDVTFLKPDGYSRNFNSHPEHAIPCTMLLQYLFLRSVRNLVSLIH